VILEEIIKIQNSKMEGVLLTIKEDSEYYMLQHLYYIHQYSYVNILNAFREGRKTLMLGRIGFAEIIIIPMFLIIPSVLLYFIIKLAVKHAIKELKDNNIL